MIKFMKVLALTGVLSLSACAHSKVESASPEEAARIDRELVRETVVFEPGSKEGAKVPDISAPRLRAVWVPERIEGTRLIEAHREWILEGDVSLLGIPQERKAK